MNNTQGNNPYGNNTYSNNGQPVGNYNSYGTNNQYGYQTPNMGNYPNKNQPESGNGLAIASMVLGIISVVLCCTFVNVIAAVLAIIFGAMHLSKESSNAMAISGVVTGIVGIVATIIFFFM